MPVPDDQIRPRTVGVSPAQRPARARGEPGEVADLSQMTSGVTVTLLVCDAWFDVLLDASGSAVWVSLASALLLELPLATLLVVVCRWLLTVTIRRAWRLAGRPEPAPSLLHLPIFGTPVD